MAEDLFTHENRGSKKSRNVPKIIQLEPEPKSHDSQAKFCPLYKAQELDTEGEVHASMSYDGSASSLSYSPCSFE